MDPATEDQVVVGSGIVKGKRTKRQRPQSPIPFAITAHSSSGGENNNLDGGENNNINNNKEIILFSSPTASNYEYNQDHSKLTEEEEDMANCLILLATRPMKINSGEITNGNFGYNFGYKPNNNNNSRKIMETANSNGAKAGYYVYECKTCNRTFPSFQALGGHRASHKKPKAMVVGPASNFAISSDEEDHHYDKGVHLKNVSMSSSLSLQLTSNPRANNNNMSFQNANKYNNNKSKVHECSICGAEFTSGQALGGHMRRHRGPTLSTHHNANITTKHLSLTSSVRIETNNLSQRSTLPKPKPVLSLDLDLNLPAPPEDHDHNHESKLLFVSTQQEKPQQQPQSQPPLVFSAPALVDCHY